MSSTLDIDWKKVGKLLEAGCSGVEVAAAIGVHENTLYNRCKSDLGVDFVAYRQEKRASGDSLLRAKQMELAEQGDKTMLVWLGKQRLGQKEKVETENTHKGEAFEVRIVKRDKPTEEEATE